MMDQINILIVEDEILTRKGVHRTLMKWANGQTTINSVKNGLEALAFIEENPVDVMMTDIKMPGMDGLALIKTLKRSNINIVTILLTGFADFEYAKQALTHGVMDYILKPVNPNEVISIIEKGVQLAKEQKSIGHIKSNLQLKSLIETESKPVQNDLINMALKYIHSHMKDELTLKLISSQVHINANYFSGLFRDETGINFSEYVTNIRMKKAKELLIFTQMRIFEIADEVGYQSLKYFVQVFKDHERVTPKQYREQHK